MKKVIDYILAQKMVVAGVGLLAVLVIGFSLWSSGNGKVKTLTVARGDFVQQVSVSGKVMADQEVDLGFSQSGRIASIYVKEGTVVARGALIAEMENGELYAALLQKQAALDRARAELDALRRGTRPEELAVSESAVAASRASLLAAEQGVVDAILSAYATADSNVHATTDHFFSNPNTASPQLTFKVSDTSLATAVEAKRVAIGATLGAWEKSVAQLSASSNLDLPALSAQGYLADVSKYLADVGAALALAFPSSSVSQATLEGYKTDVATARTSVNTVTSALTTALKTRAAAAAALTTSERDLALLRAGATQEDIRAEEASVKAAEADVLAASSQLSKTQIRAPFGGTVTKIDAKVGKSVSPGEAQVSIIGSGAFQIESFVPEVNVALIKPGNKAAITFDSYGENQVFEAEVVTVDLGETTRDGVTTYRTVLAFLKEDDRIRSGMTANVVITTEEKANVIAIPQTLVIYMNGIKTVRVVENGEVVEREVTTGLVSSSGDIEVLSGLQEGDSVVLE